MTYEEAVSYVENASTFGIQLGLRRITELLRRLQDPQKKYKTVHVTGTNGKGSVTAMIASVLETAGYEVGRYTSPHLESYTERIHVNGKDISEDAFATAVQTVAKAVESMQAEGWERPTAFEMLTAAAFWYFAERKVAYAVIEVGLGGLLDSTNVIIPEVAVITNVDLDHMKYCGATIAEIAVQKAGIIKEGVPTVTTATGEALAVIARTAYKKHSRLYASDHSFFVTADSLSDPLRGQTVTVREAYGFTVSAMLPLLGEHQKRNCAAAMMALLLLARTQKSLTRTALEKGIQQVRWPGRFQVLQVQGRTVVIDGAHNPAGIHAFCQTYDRVFSKRPRVFVFSVLADKAYPQMVQELFHADDIVFCAPAPTPRTADPQQLAALLPCAATACETLERAWEEAFHALTEDAVLCVVGSLYMQNNIRKYIQQKYGLSI